MLRNSMQHLILAAIMVALLNACASTPAPTPSVKRLKDYPDHAFNPKEYVRGMEEGGHNLLIWQDPSADLSKYRFLNVRDFGGRLLPEKDVLPYDSFISHFNTAFQSRLTLPREESSDALLIEGAVVECNPGSQYLRYTFKFGAGKASGAVACEVYEPGEARPCMRIYARDRASGMFSGAGGDSVVYLNHIFEQIAMRLGTVLDERTGR